MLSIKEKLYKKESTVLFLKRWLPPLICFLASFFICNFKIGESFYPLGTAFLSSVGTSLFPFSLLGTVVGTFCFSFGRNSLRYLASLILFSGCRYTFSGLFKNGSSFTSALFAAISLFGTGLFIVIADFSVFNLILYSSESLFCFMASVIFNKSIASFFKTSPPGRETLISLCLSLSFFYISTADIRISGISPAEIAATFLICHSALYLKSPCSLILGMIFGISGFIKGSVSSLLIFTGGAAAVYAFLPAGKFLSLLAYMLSALFLLVLQKPDPSVFIYFLEITAGLLPALFVPGKIYRSFAFRNDSKTDRSFKNAASFRLLKTSKALREIGEVTGRVSEEVEKLKGEPMESYIDRAVNKCCRKCKNSPTCWQKFYSRTREEVSLLFTDGKNSLMPDMDRFKKMTGCLRINTMESCILEESRKYGEFLRSKSCSQNIRYIMCDQFSGMSSLLSGIRQDVLDLEPLDEDKKICSILSSAGCLKDSVISGKHKGENIFISALFSDFSLKKFSLPDLTECLSQEVKTCLCEPVLYEEENGIKRLFWREKPPFRCEYDYYQQSCENKRICGDSAEIEKDLAGNQLFFLSDGMGVGGDAAIDSCMTTSLLSKLMASGASFPSSLKLVSSSLLSLKEERLCTVDFLFTDLFKGVLKFYKAGAAPSYILRDGKCRKINNSALPAGILGGAEAAESVFSLKNNDIVLMVTDGITETGEDWILSSLPPLKDLSPLEIAKEITFLAEKRSTDGRCDDMTALCVKFYLS